MVAPGLLSAKVFLEITYCSTPWLFWDYSLGVCSPFMLWVLFHMLCVWPHMVQACVLIVTPSPHHHRLGYPNNVILLQLFLLGITKGLPRWDSHYPYSHVFWPNGQAVIQ